MIQWYGIYWNIEMVFYIYIKSINFMRKDLYYEDYHINDDDTAFFGLIHFANSYGFLLIGASESEDCSG